jgi:transcriptional regulator with XRE-family HTH domain
VTKHYQLLLKQAREERGWSQKDVAEKIGTDSKTVSRWERRVAYPSPYFRQKLAELFKKSLRELDLLNSSERELEDGAPSISRLPAGLFEGAENPPWGHADLLGMVSSFVIGLFLQTVFDLTTGIQAVILGGLLGGLLWPIGQHQHRGWHS